MSINMHSDQDLDDNNYCLINGIVNVNGLYSDQGTHRTVKSLLGRDYVHHVAPNEL